MTYAYFHGILILLLFWLAFFLGARHYRKEMLWGSLVGAAFGWVNYFFIPDFWDPPIIFDLTRKIGFEIETTLFMFSWGGIATVIYELFFQKRIADVCRCVVAYPRWFPLIVATVLYGLLAILTGLSAAYVGIFSLLVATAIMIGYRHDIIPEVLGGAVLFGVFYFLFYELFVIIHPQFVETYYKLENLTGVLVMGVPLGEILMGITFGAFFSPMYIYIKRKWSS